jgi:IstB-like ATP binding protein
MIGVSLPASMSSFTNEEWGEVLGDDVMAAALIDRVLHHCHLVNIRGNSYRTREHTELYRTLQSDVGCGGAGYTLAQVKTERSLIDHGVCNFRPPQPRGFDPALTRGAPFAALRTLYFGF